MSVDAPDIVAPAFMWVPGRGRGSEAASDAVELAAQAGLFLDPEQLLILQVAMAEQDDGRPVFETCVVEARQNGKTWGLMAAALYDLFIAENQLVVWTAHEFSTAMRTFKDFKMLILNSDFLSSRVLKVNNANGDEGFEFRSGAELKFRARTKAGGRGIAGDKVFLDEAFALDDAHMGALLPILTTRRDAQVRYASSAGLAKSEILRGLRDRGRSGGDPSLAYVEWTATGACAVETCSHARGADGCMLDDREQWRQANPGVARRREDWADHIAAERRTLPPLEFARERLTLWDDPDAAVLPYPPKKWGELVDPASRRAEDATPSFCVDTNPIRTHTAIAWAAKAVDGHTHVEVVEYEPHGPWVLERVKDLQAKNSNAEFVILKDGQAASLIPDLEDAGVTVVTYQLADFRAACGEFVDAIDDRTIRHVNQEPVNDAVLMARKRESEGAWTLARKGGDISPLVAVVCAYHRHAVTDVDYDVLQSIF